MATRTSTLCALALAYAVSGRELRAQEPAPAGPGSGPTRLFFAPTARSMPSGQWAVGVTEVLFPWGEVSVTKCLSVLGFGIPIEGGGVALVPKLQLWGGRHIQAAAGVAHVLAFQGDSGGVGYGVLTGGGADLGVTVGYGYGYGSLADSGGSRSVLLVGLDAALGPHVRLIGEGYIGGAALGMPDQTIAAGLRLAHGRFWADLGVVVPFYETGSGMPVPLLTVGWSFGRTPPQALGPGSALRGAPLLSSPPRPNPGWAPLSPTDRS
ncbi:MAG: hypothetical protein ACHP85_22885 [Burkholderiales bacterium]|jgi:hypothetical protein